MEFKSLINEILNFIWSIFLLFETQSWVNKPEIKLQELTR